MKSQLRLSLVDRDENKVNLTISEPKETVTLEEVTDFINYITTNEILFGKTALLDSLEKAVVVTVTEREL